MLIVGVLASSAPWLLHNYLYSGQVTLDAPFQYQIIASQYQYSGNLDINAIDLKGKSLFGILLTFAIRDPKFVAGFIGTHFFATLINSLLALPLFETYNGLHAPLNLYWMNGPVNLSGPNIALLIVYLAVISIGLGAAWKRLRWAGLAPLAFALGYALANEMGASPAGAMTCPPIGSRIFILASARRRFWAQSRFSSGQHETAWLPRRCDEPAVQSNWTVLGLICVAFALIGALPWMAEGVAYAALRGRKIAGARKPLGCIYGGKAIAHRSVCHREVRGRPASHPGDRAHPVSTILLARHRPGIRSSVARLRRA